MVRRRALLSIVAVGLLGLGFVSVLVSTPRAQEQPTQAQQAQESCLICHSDIKVEHQAGIHASYGIGCVDCHGGDPSKVDLSAMAEEAGFRGTPKREEIPKLCASCHADVERMRPYGIPTDQYAEYLTSRHGLRLAQGDTKVAVCTDCHGVHKILPADDPESTIYPRNIPRTCAKCHSDKELMAEYGLPTDQYEDFIQGIHGVALLEESNPKAPDCATCHGAHGATPPGVGSISEVCGQCHGRIRGLFNESPHREMAHEAETPGCSVCHGDHRVTKPEEELFDRTCVKCHSRDSEPFLTGQKLKTLLVKAKGATEEAEEKLKEAEAHGFEVSVYRFRLLEARGYLIEAASTQHTLNLEEVEALARKARSLGEEVRGDALALLASTKVRLVGLAILWVLIIFAAIVVYLYKVRLASGG